MKANFRIVLDKIFTILTGLAVLSMVLALIVILGPMLYRGLGAIFFRGTIEFRKMQLAEFQHGNPEKIKQEDIKVQQARQTVYDMINKFRNGVDTEELIDHAKQIDRTYGKELQLQDVDREKYRELRGLSRDIRDNLEEAFSSDNAEHISILFCNTNLTNDLREQPQKNISN